CTPTAHVRAARSRRRADACPRRRCSRRPPPARPQEETH
ncbi:MAG: hypothetical protein AVDCRST_MAG40-2272, partial [uncultured Gemmatimonadaceae bacterium]